MDLIVIPSMGRAKRQQSLYFLKQTGITDSYPTVVCVYEDEVQSYQKMSFKGKRIKGIEIVAVPKQYQGIARKREFILTELAMQRKARFVYMIDDDLSFCWRPDLSNEYMPYINDKPLEMHSMVETLTMWLEQGIAHVGLISRQANRKLNVAYLEPSRLMNAHAYDTHVLWDLMDKGHLQFGRVPFMEDFDLTLQLLRRGYINRLSCQYAWTTTSNQDGGCSIYRTAETHADAARTLAELHSPFVKLIEKKAKTWKNNLTTRLDVRIEWKKAYASSKRRRLRKAA